MYKNKRNKIYMKMGAKDRTQTYKICENDTKGGVKVKEDQVNTYKRVGWPK